MPTTFRASPIPLIDEEVTRTSWSPEEIWVVSAGAPLQPTVAVGDPAGAVTAAD